jgi:hypothetical protein
VLVPIGGILLLAGVVDTAQAASTSR